MSPEELWEKMRKAFNWPSYPLIKNYKVQQRLWVDIGGENISKMRGAIWDLARQGTKVEGYPKTNPSTGYYFRTGGIHLTLNYYDSHTGMVTVLNPSPHPSSSEKKVLEGLSGWNEEGTPPNAFFLNRFPASSLGMVLDSPATMLGQTYMAELPAPSGFINWIGSKPLSSRK